MSNMWTIQLTDGSFYPGNKYYYAICMKCSRKFRAKDLLIQWDGKLVCKDDWVRKHPALTPLHFRPERALNPKFVRPEQEAIEEQPFVAQDPNTWRTW